MAPSVMASSATSVAPFQGLKSTAGLPASRRSSSTGLGNINNGGRIRCMQVWPIEGIKKFETLSYLPQAIMYYYQFTRSNCRSISEPLRTSSDKHYH
ncbi:ribulose bisphosphate carboxylase small subunit, chloroplastic 2-like [Phragmites australis]|uniref:ribulose bisphosphate carboxylase small subunit, chloroplastic 2-like n=1 Tax=Phragmites australis TaxID=29695 RepID=UPI002D7858C2|nr:ribulose bisphosphate carboxylase small subunit, chloroplastic 2-like [Phragmites australis]